MTATRIKSEFSRRARGPGGYEKAPPALFEGGGEGDAAGDGDGDLVGGILVAGGGRVRLRCTL